MATNLDASKSCTGNERAAPQLAKRLFRMFHETIYRKTPSLLVHCNLAVDISSMCRQYLVFEQTHWKTGSPSCAPKFCPKYLKKPSVFRVVSSYDVNRRSETWIRNHKFFAFITMIQFVIARNWSEQSPIMIRLKPHFLCRYHYRGKKASLHALIYTLTEKDWFVHVRTQHLGRVSWWERNFVSGW